MNAAPRTAEQLPVSRAVGRRVAALREQRRWSLRELSGRTAAVGKRIPFVSLGRIEQARHTAKPVTAVSVDDLVSLATVFGLRPEQLLTAPVCSACLDAPPTGFTCTSCSITAPPSREATP